jgi:hypothetical protein
MHWPAPRWEQSQHRFIPLGGAIMDLNKEVPRSPRDKMLGLVSLKRTIDKAKAHNAGTLGEYDYDCPHDRPLFEFLGTNGDEFARKVDELGTDENIEDWVKRDLLKGKTADDIETFNRQREAWSPAADRRQYFDDMRSRIAPERTDITTWFDLLDLDEKRTVPRRTATPV